MSRQISRAESWERTYEAFQDINFSAFDYNTVKQSLIDYVKDYFPEQFNDFIESSEFIAIVETFAYVSELMAYRIDMNTHENFISTAQRKQSILRLAKLVSYNASRNMPGRGLVKITSITTTETVLDSKGINLANRRIIWNDPENVDWKEHFFLVINRILQQDFGTVAPSDRIQVDDVLFELYKLNNKQLTNGVLPYSALAGGSSVPMELVPIGVGDSGIFERRPEVGANFSIVYGSDGIGDSSDTTGFFMYTKQGQLQKQRHSYDGVTPNQNTLLDVANINNTDVWVNNVNPDTGDVLSDRVIDSRGRNLGVIGEWQEISLGNGNILFNTDPYRNKYELETLEDDKVRVLFGDGEFADIPSGAFDIWFRTSVNDDIVINRRDVIDRKSALSYVDTNNTPQTLSFTFSLVSAITNAASSEDIESIRRVAPSVYYTQARMVNGQDYNTFMLQDASILKTRAFNRTYSGDSKYLAWHDPSENYDNVKLFGDDLALYYEDDIFNVSVPTSTAINATIINYIQPQLSNAEVLIFHENNNIAIPRRAFTTAEYDEIEQAIIAAEASSAGFPLKLVYTDDQIKATQGVDFGGSLTSPGTFPIHRRTNQAVYQLDVIINGTTYNVRYYTHILGGFPTDTITSSPTGVGTSIDTMQELVDDLNIQLGADLTVTFVDGNLIFESNVETYGNTASNISITDVSLFRMLTNTNNQVPEVTSPIQSSLIPTWKPFVNDTLLGTSIIDTFQISLINGSNWDLTFRGLRLVGESPTTRFWFTNGLDGVQNGNTLNVNYDTISILSANVDSEGHILGATLPLNVVGVINSTEKPNTGIPDISKLSLITVDESGDIDTQSSLLPSIIDATGQLTVSAANVEEVINFPEYLRFNAGVDELEVRNAVNNQLLQVGVDYTELPGSFNDGISRGIETTLSNTATNLDITVFQYVYQYRSDGGEWITSQPSDRNVSLRTSTIADRYRLNDPNVRRFRGRMGFNFLWQHTSPRYNLIDPATTNIIDTYLITRAYYTQLKDHLYNNGPSPSVQTPLQLRLDYNYLLDSKMISDTVVLHPGNIKLIFGDKSQPSLRAKIKVIRDANATLTDNEIKVNVVNSIRDFFELDQWEFGETFNFTELSAVIHSSLVGSVSSVVLVPDSADNTFGDLYQVFAREDEIIQPDINVEDVEIIEYLSTTDLRQN